MRAQYTKKPIGSLLALSKTLDVDIGILKNTVKNIEKHYHQYFIPKKDGGERCINIPTNHIKIIQKRINNRIFNNVIYPSYLFGGIKEKNYVKNAEEHSGCKAIITLDVKNFYPSITIENVRNIFQYFLKFPFDVSDLLANLCCLKGRVPQGACTSSHLANLVLHDNEYSIVQYIKNKKWIYTRLLDDIAISSKSKFKEKDIEIIIRNVKNMLGSKKLKINNKKTKILSKANPVNLMEITGLWLNRGKPRAHRVDRNTIRNEVYRCEVMAKVSRSTKEYHDFHNYVSGRVSKLTHLNHVNSGKYRQRLRDILPFYDIREATKLLKQAEYMIKTNKNNRSSVSYYKKYNIINYRINILTRTDKNLAIKIRKILSSCKPNVKLD